MSGTNYTLTPNLGLYKPTVDADGDQWGNHWNINADKLDTAATGFANVSYNMLAAGAAGNGTTDDTAAIQTWLNALPHGVEVVLPAGHQFLIDSADLTIPPGITVCGQGGMDTLELLLGPAFILNPNYSIVVQSGVRLSNFKVLRKGLLSAPTTAQANTAVAAWIAEAPLRKTSASTASGNTLPFTNTTGITAGMKAYGEALPFGGTTVASFVANTSVTFASVVNFPVPLGSYVHFGNSIGIRLAANHGGANFDRLVIVGFNTGILTEAGELYIDTIEPDCITALYAIHGGDASYISKIHCIPLYGGDWNKRTGPCFLLARADGWSLSNCTSVGWATGFVLSAVGGVTLHRCWMETAFDGTTPTTSFRTEGNIVNECSLDQCIASADCGFDMQHVSGGMSLIGCMSAAGPGDANNIAHFRLGPASYGTISQSLIIAGSIIPFVVQAGVGQWHINTPMIFSAPTTWISGATADVANVSVIGGPLNGPLTLGAFSGQPVNVVGASATFQLNRTGTGNGVVVGPAAAGNFPTVGAAGSDTNIALTIASKGSGNVSLGNGFPVLGIYPVASPYNFVNVIGAATGALPQIVAAGLDANVNLYLAGQGTGGVMLAGAVGFQGTTPIAKRTGWGAPTGTATRTTFVTTSVTLPTLAEHVKALIDDLTAYGLIGP